MFVLYVPVTPIASVCPLSLQLFQTLVASLLTVVQLWKRADPTEVGRLREETELTYACFAMVGAVLRKDYRIPKLHDLLHVSKDVELWSGSVCTSTGA